MEKNYVGCERNITLIMDFYELTMAYNYFKLGKQDEIVYFDMFYRKNPDQGGFVIFACVRGVCSRKVSGNIWRYRGRK